MISRARTVGSAPYADQPVADVSGAPGPGVFLLYDGVCGLCNQAVTFVLARDRVRTMRFAALQSDFGREVIARHTELHGVDSLILVDRDPVLGEAVWVRWNAVMAIARYLGGWWSRLARAGNVVVPRALGDWMYDAVAKRRHRGAARFDSCPLPAPEHRARFLA